MQIILLQDIAAQFIASNGAPDVECTFDAIFPKVVVTVPFCNGIERSSDTGRAFPGEKGKEIENSI